ncbi:MAG: hypothetical protein RIE77_04420 [Phycisphaerales bacterium]
MQRIIAVVVAGGLGLAVLGLGQDAADRTNLAPPVEIGGSRLQIESLSANVKVVGLPNPSPGVSRSLTINGKITPLAAPAAGDTPGDQPTGSTAVVWAEVVSLKGDGRDVEVSDSRRRSPQGIVRERQQMGQLLLGNPNAFFQSHPHLPPEQLAAIRGISSTFSAHAQLEAVPDYIDRMVVNLDVVHASTVQRFSMPLEAMSEHKELVPGVRFLVRNVDDRDVNGTKYLRVSLEYFIDRVNAGDADEASLETTPLVPVVAIRDANGHVLSILSRAQETETRDQFIVSVPDLNVAFNPRVKPPLRVEVIVVHGLERRDVEMVVEGVALAGGE